MNADAAPALGQDSASSNRRRSKRARRRAVVDDAVVLEAGDEEIPAVVDGVEDKRKGASVTIKSERFGEQSLSWRLLNSQVRGRTALHFTSALRKFWVLSVRWCV